MGGGFVRSELAAADSGGGGGRGGGGFGGGAGGGSRAVDYIREWRNLRLVRRTVDDEVFRKQNVDLLVTPTIREPAWSIEDELGRVANGRARNPKPGNTRSLDDYGLPTITVPCGFSKSGMPIGLQISGPNLGEINVLAMAHAYPGVDRLAQSDAAAAPARHESARAVQDGGWPDGRVGRPVGQVRDRPPPKIRFL